MQSIESIELDVTISAEGHIFLPPELQSLYGRHVRIILHLDDQPLCSASTAQPGSND